MAKLELSAERQDLLAIVRVDGRVVRENQAELRSCLEGLIGEGTTRLALDLGKVDYMDSAALGCCASIQKTLRARGSGAIVVFNASQNIQKVWKLIRLDLVVPLFPSEEEAIAGLAETPS
jgi:anti-anti-sigma factor